MKKYINIAFIYGILGICGGVFCMYTCLCLA